MDSRQNHLLLEETTFALGKLSALTGGHPYCRAWRVRSALSSVVSWAYADGEKVDSTRIWADIAGTAYHPVKDHGVDKRTARALSVVLDLDPAFPLDEDFAALRKARSWLSYSRGRTGLDAIILGYRRWLSSVGFGFAGRLAFVETLAHAGFAPHPFPALAPRRDCRNASGAVDELTLRETVRDAAVLACEEWYIFTRSIDQACAQLSARRKNSRQQAALLALLEAPVLTPKGLADQCALSVEGASGILDEFVRIGLAEEITARKWGRQFTFRDPQGTELVYQAQSPRYKRVHG